MDDELEDGGPEAAAGFDIEGGEKGELVVGGVDVQADVHGGAEEGTGREPDEVAVYGGGQAGEEQEAVDSDAVEVHAGFFRWR